jgi:hypothetical protein
MDRFFFYLFSWTCAIPMEDLFSILEEGRKCEYRK